MAEVKLYEEQQSFEDDQIINDPIDNIDIHNEPDPIEQVEQEVELKAGRRNKDGKVVDEDGRTYEDVLKEMGLEVDTSGHYVNNNELYDHMVLYCDARDKALAAGLPKPPVDDFIGEAIMKIATHLSFRPNFIGYSYRQDMIGDAIDNCLTYIDSFDPKKSRNAFAYLTQICWCAFIRRLKIEKKNSIIKGKLMMSSDISEALTLEDDDDRQLLNDSGNVHTFMELAQEEEDKIKRKKQEKLQQKAAKKASKVEKTPLEQFVINESE